VPILDASVGAALVLPTDPFHAAASAWLRPAMLARADLVAPALLLPEVAGAVRRATGKAADAELAREHMLALVGLVLVDLTLARAEESGRLAGALGLKGCDAVYVALAKEFDDVLVTFDREQYERAQGVVRVAWPGR